jgi:hypothetical protein
MIWCIKYEIKYTRTKGNWTKNKNNFVSQNPTDLAEGS